MSADPNELMTLYRARFGPVAADRMRVWTVLNNDFFQKRIPRDSTVLDLGCGWGEFINTIDASEKLAMDLNPDASEHLDPSVRLLAQDCSEPWPLDDGAVDVVFTSNFLEHLPDKERLTATVGEAFRCLRPGGTLVCLGPNIRYLPGMYWDFYDHHIPLSERSLGECLEAAGFCIEESVPRFLPFTMANGKPAPNWVIRLYLKLPVVWPLFGRQFLVVARRQ
jgi:SAM-dependent methyltransferase